VPDSEREETMAFRVAFSGSSGTGKSTLARVYELMLTELHERALDHGTRLIRVWEKDSNARIERVRKALDVRIG
jgi:adenylylsulfate kinase-like enzyme